jgi:Glycosyltransferase 61
MVNPGFSATRLPATGNPGCIAGSAERPRTGEDWHITVTIPPGGSVEHYHHFLTGFFAPLIYHIKTDWAGVGFNRLLVRSCGPLDPIVRDFTDGRVEIIDKDRHREMAEPSRSSKAPAAQIQPFDFLTIEGCDLPIAYNRQIFMQAREHVLSNETIRAEIALLDDDWSRPRILLVERGSSHPFYNSEQSEIKGSGRDRRSIGNHDALFYLLRRSFAGCRNIIAENLSFVRQVALFSLADIIIAQHGAALANMLWARQGTTVIEIYPVPQGLKHDFFFYLSRCMGLRYRRVWQQDEHSEVDLDKVHRIVARAAVRPASRVLTGLHSASYCFLRPTLRTRLFLRRNSRRVVRRIRRLII